MVDRGWFWVIWGVVCFGTAEAFLPAQNPRWTPTYNMAQSTLCMAANFSGWYDLNLAVRFGIMDYDWSNDKKDWALARPMDCEERMLTQAQRTKKLSNTTKVFVYRNVVKALPWFQSVRKLLDDPAYSGFFLKFDPLVQPHVPACTQGKCSVYYHDQEQTPEVPTPSDPNPDGACKGECDCGTQPCGEYLFDHRNGSMLTQWLLEEYIMSPTALGSRDVDGLFIDDYWCSHIVNGSDNCHDPVQGPSEINKYSQVDMGLSDQDIADITKGWLQNMAAIQQAIVDAGKYTWSLMPGQANANAAPLVVTKKNCQAELSKVCGAAQSPYDDVPLLMGLTPPPANTSIFPDIKQQVASFLLMRGPYAWLGYGVWGMGWRSDVPFPAEVWGTDYGEPLQASCVADATNTVFTRKWSKATVSLDCEAWTATLSG